MSVHAFSCKLWSGEVVPLSRYAGKALVIVNTASLCGFTASNMTGLNMLQDSYDRPHVRDQKYRNRLQVLAFPSNQFANQEPKTGCDLNAWAQSLYGISFPMFERVDVKGAKADDLWRFLSAELGAPKWNFTKYLVDPDGRPIRKYNPAVPPESMKTDIDALLDGWKK